jgi:hypothetical protein
MAAWQCRHLAQTNVLSRDWQGIKERTEMRTLNPQEQGSVSVNITKPEG